MNFLKYNYTHYNLIKLVFIQLYKIFHELVQLTVEGDNNGKVPELVKCIKESSAEIDALIESISSNLSKNISLDLIVI